MAEEISSKRIDRGSGKGLDLIAAVTGQPTERLSIA
jgi:hypothetical protein